MTKFETIEELIETTINGNKIKGQYCETYEKMTKRILHSDLDMYDSYLSEVYMHKVSTTGTKVKRISELAEVCLGKR